MNATETTKSKANAASKKLAISYKDVVVFSLLGVCFAFIIYAFVEILPKITPHSPPRGILPNGSPQAKLERMHANLKIIEGRIPYTDTLDQGSMEKLDTIVKDLKTLKTEALVSKNAGENISDSIKMQDTLFERVEQISTLEIRCNPDFIELKMIQIIKLKTFNSKEKEIFRNSVDEMKNIVCDDSVFTDKNRKQAILKSLKKYFKDKLKKIDLSEAEGTYDFNIGKIVYDHEKGKITKYEVNFNPLLIFLGYQEICSIFDTCKSEKENSPNDNRNEHDPSQKEIPPLIFA